MKMSLFNKKKQMQKVLFTISPTNKYKKVLFEWQVVFLFEL